MELSGLGMFKSEGLHSLPYTQMSSDSSLYPKQIEDYGLSVGSAEPRGNSSSSRRSDPAPPPQRPLRSKSS